MIKTDFNKGWLFCREGETERIAVDVPHDAMLREPRTDDSEGGTNTGWFAGYDYEYTKEFDVSADVIGRELILEFEGVYRNAEVYVNGEKAAFNPYGYGNFYVNITDKAQEGKNTVLVKAKNAEQPNSRWYTQPRRDIPVSAFTWMRSRLPAAWAAAEKALALSRS